ncbi:MAG: ABC transporter permease, partial [Christensenellaceae bacterium]|nr:ABC transporter permease [Christensenellaceae bacterium]
ASQAQIDAGSALAGMVALALGDPAAESALADQIEAQRPDLAYALRQGQGAAALAALQQELQGAQAQLDAEKARLPAAQAELDAAAQKLKGARFQLDRAQIELEEGRAAGRLELAGALKKLDESETAWEEGRAELEDGKAALKKSRRELLDGEKELSDAEQELLDGEKELADAKAEYAKKEPGALRDIANAEEELAKGERDLAAFKLPKWYALLSGEANAGIVGYGQDTRRVDQIGLVIPILFFLIAILVAMTSMTRLVDTDRSLIGAYKALGYGDMAILMRYVLYALTASFLGAILGLAVGLRLFPSVIANAYGTLYTLPPLETQLNLSYAVLSILAAVCSATLPAAFVCRAALREGPAGLLRPASPPSGRRILLERLGPLWRMLNFSQKLALRNLFRYKKRLIMTLLGVAGCTALMLAGFGLRDSITTVVPKQMGQLQIYSMQLDFRSDADEDERLQLEAALGDSPEIKEQTQVFRKAIEALSASAPGEKLGVELVIPLDEAALPAFLALKDWNGGRALPLPENGVLISKKMADILGLRPGDTLRLRIANEDEAEFTVSAVVENYISHYVFMQKALYDAAFEEKTQANGLFLNLGEGADEKALAERLLALDAVTAVTLQSEMSARFSDVVNAMNTVMVVLIASAAALVFVVLYCLNSINLEERGRELATIKVLGFFDGELAAYIYRENVLLTLFGIGLGLFLGVLLERYILATMEIDLFMFSLDILWPSYVFSALLTALFAALVNAIMYRHIKKIDMVSSLKSVE